MSQISTQEFERLPLRVHDFLAGVPLHDAWAVDLPRMRSGITLDEFLRAAVWPRGTTPRCTRSPKVRPDDPAVQAVLRCSIIAAFFRR